MTKHTSCFDEYFTPEERVRYSELTDLMQYHKDKASIEMQKAAEVKRLRQKLNYRAANRKRGRAASAAVKAAKLADRYGL